MPMSTDASELPPDEARGLWLALTASQLGAAYQAVGLPNQEQAARASGDAGLIAYGSTLLLATGQPPRGRG